MSDSATTAEPRHALDPAALDTLFREGRSFNQWVPTPMSEAEIREIHDLAKWGPTSANGNPARFIWASSDAGREKVAACVLPGNASKVLTASAVAIIGFDTDFHNNFHLLLPHAPERYQAHFEANPQDRFDTAFRNSSLQGAYLIMAARALGYDCGPISGFDHDAMNKAFFEGTSVRANFLCCIGRGDRAALTPRNRRYDFEQISQII
jgi:3-hydroxypropanoate dehydrogenase